MQVFDKLYIFLTLIVLTVGCAEKQFDPNDAQKSFGIAKEPYDDESFEIALQKLGEFKARFPYSKYAIEAELLIANAHFELGQFTEAALSYEQFVKLHPKHPKVDFALFRVGESYWEDAPEEIDREQDYTERAVSEWRKLVNQRPDSTYTPKAKELIKTGERRIAESIEFIIDFYYKLEIYHACAYRALQLAEDYGQFRDLRIKATQMAVLSLKEIAKAKAEDPKTDKNLYFKTMTADEILQKANLLEVKLNNFKSAG